MIFSSVMMTAILLKQMNFFSPFTASNIKLDSALGCQTIGLGSTTRIGHHMGGSDPVTFDVTGATHSENIYNYILAKVSFFKQPIRPI